VKTVVEGDQQAGMQAFMSGQVKVEGDMSVLMQIQSAGPPSQEGEVLRKRIREMTEA
jgi:putative sterol carrier protein